MNEDQKNETEELTFLKDRRFYVGFCATVALFATLNVASYFWFASPDEVAKHGIAKSHKVGFPRPFWVEDRIGFVSRANNPNLRLKPFESEFYWGAFLFNIALASLASFEAGRRCARRTKPSKTEQPSAPNPQ